ncbi:MAG: serine/threonine protein kinase [Planctomycetes bacterium]|nr:serine/threonine protein kinase [Planctomycetota bacterium]
MDSDSSLDDRLDALVAEYADALHAGKRPSRTNFLDRVPPAARPGLERVLKMLDAGLARAPSATTPLMPGLQLDHYRLEHEIGRGGMALVWLAHDTKLRRPVALKIMRPGLALEQRHVDRFRREALAVASLKHPHIVQIHGVGETANYHWLAMEYVEGPSLATVLDALPTDRPRTAEDLARATGITALAANGRSFEAALARLLAPIADALATAHGKGMIHRDIKPSNILIHRDGRAVVADFGLAKGGDDPALSLTGEGLGTPYYMSPEQAYLTGKTVDHRTDVYSLGITLYEALTGKRPFAGHNFLEVVEAIRTTLPPSIRAIARERSPDAAAVVRRAMARDPEQRYASALELREDLEALADLRTTAARRVEGGALRRALTHLRAISSGESFEYRSAATLLGLPLLHVISGARAPGQQKRVAKGWIAVGDHAYGVLMATGSFACGGLAFGGMSIGVISGGGITAGIAAIGGVAAGLFTFAGIGLGWLSTSGIAIGHAASGGIALGKYAAGGLAYGSYVMSQQHVDPEAREFFDLAFSSIGGFLHAAFGI